MTALPDDTLTVRPDPRPAAPGRRRRTGRGQPQLAAGTYARLPRGESRVPGRLNGVMHHLRLEAAAAWK